MQLRIVFSHSCLFLIFQFYLFRENFLDYLSKSLAADPKKRILLKVII